MYTVYTRIVAVANINFIPLYPLKKNKYFRYKRVFNEYYRTSEPRNGRKEKLSINISLSLGTKNLAPSLEGGGGDYSRVGYYWYETVYTVDIGYRDNFVWFVVPDDDVPY